MAKQGFQKENTSPQTQKMQLMLYVSCLGYCISSPEHKGQFPHLPNLLHARPGQAWVPCGSLIRDKETSLCPACF